MRLKAITVENFRSIDGPVSLPLDASFVLIHGKNGAGKTSLLSALELALTGEVPGLRRLDAEYRKHLVHHESKTSTIGLRYVDQGTRPEQHLYTLNEGGASAEGLLSKELSAHYAERCYLAQSTLSRLLEVYQQAKPGMDSPLGRYVREILRLDQIDNLLDGLHAAEDRRRTRRDVPEYRDSENRMAAIQRDLESLSRQAREVAEEIEERQSNLIPDIVLLGHRDVTMNHLSEVKHWESVLLDAFDDAQLSGLEETSRELRSITARLAKHNRNASRSSIEEQLQERVGNAKSAAQIWWAETGTPLEDCLDQARQYFPDLPSVAATDPELAVNTALDRITTEVSRCRGIVARQTGLDEATDDARQRMSGLDARVQALEMRLENGVADAERLAGVLSEVVSFIEDEICIVCERDYSEVSTIPLSVEVTSRIGDLGAAAEEIREVTRLRSGAIADRRRLATDLAVLDSEILSTVEREDLEQRIEDLDRILKSLVALEQKVGEGQHILLELSEAQNALAVHQAQDREVVEMREQLKSIASRLGHRERFAETILSELAVVLSEEVSQRISKLAAQRTIRNRLAHQLPLLSSMYEAANEISNQLTEKSAELRAEEQRYAEAEGRRLLVRKLYKTVSEIRDETVLQVFNEKLNRLWRDLFIRLAPAEPYVPAFDFPPGGQRIGSAPLTTMHRTGGSGGAPGTMLSAGNLNTAALTLFVALHLSASPKLPWLVLDDPVQAMDDVHVAQFAALLRSIAREHNRSVVIAVHDEALFDYLALELAPARPGERLVTAQISRSKEGTVLTSDIATWVDEPVRVA